MTLLVGLLVLTLGAVLFIVSTVVKTFIIDEDDTEV